MTVEHLALEGDCLQLPAQLLLLPLQVTQLLPCHQVLLLLVKHVGRVLDFSRQAPDLGLRPAELVVDLLTGESASATMGLRFGQLSERAGRAPGRTVDISPWVKGIVRTTGKWNSPSSPV